MEIRKFGEPRGALTGRSPKLVVFTYSGQFATLLLTVVGVQRRFEHSGNPGSANGEVAKTRCFGLFWLVYYAMTCVLNFGRKNGFRPNFGHLGLGRNLSLAETGQI
jgi:hypothetical protein